MTWVGAIGPVCDVELRELYSCYFTIHISTAHETSGDPEFLNGWFLRWRILVFLWLSTPVLSLAPPCLCKLFLACPQQPLLSWIWWASSLKCSSSMDSSRLSSSPRLWWSVKISHLPASPRSTFRFPMSTWFSSSLKNVLKSGCLFSLIPILVNADKQHWHLHVYYSMTHNSQWYWKPVQWHKGWVDKETAVHLHNRLLSTKKDEALSFEAAWVELNDTILSEVNQA